MIVGCRKEFYQDLADDSDPRLFLITDRNQVKLMYHIPAHFLKLAVADAASLQEGDDSLLPDLMFPVDDSLFQLVRTHPVYAFHQNISEYSSVNHPFDQRERKLKSGLLSRPLKFAEITGTCSILAFLRARRIKAI